MTDQELVKRPPGRPSNRAQEVQHARRRRQGMGQERNMKLYIPENLKDPDYVYRYVNDRPGRVRNLTVQDDYDVVSASEFEEGDPYPEKGASAEGTVMARNGDKYTGERMVLLKKRKDLYEKDKAEESKAYLDRLSILRKGAPVGAGNLTEEDNAYVPGKMNTILGK